jgi:hypothetical protein
MKFGKIAVNALIIGLLLYILWILSTKSQYEPAPLVTNPTVTSGPKSLDAIPSSLDCTPGPSEKASYYTRGLTPGGLCGDQDYVRDQLREYAISDGIGGSLLEK